MKKYIVAFLPMLLCNEILSLICLCVIAAMGLIDLFKAAIERGVL